MGIDGTTYVSISPVPDQRYTEYTFTSPATGSDTFFVGGFNDPSSDAIDDFAVTEVGSRHGPGSGFTQSGPEAEHATTAPADAAAARVGPLKPAG